MRLRLPLTAATLPPAISTLPRVWIGRMAQVSIILIGFGLRLPLVGRFPLREDEAIYSVWALHFARSDPFFLHVWPDKPPLFLWLLAGAFQLLGASQSSAQLLNVAVSTLTIPVVAAIAHRLWGGHSALVAALAMSLNPFAISFAPTAFTDPLLVLAGSLALLMALARRPCWAGLWLGAAIMTKQQGLLYAALVGPVLYAVHRRPERLPVRPDWRFFAGLAAVCLPVIYWDSLRWDVAPSPWALSAANYGGLTLAPLTHWPARLAAWLELGWQLAASWPVRIALAVSACCQLWQTLRAGYTHKPQPIAQPVFTLLLTGWSLGFAVLHIVSTVQIWDRYLLPLAPMMALAVAGCAAGWLGRTSARQMALALAVALALWWPPALKAAQGQLPIGSDHGAYAGLTEALGWLRTNATDEVVLYHQTLGWHYRFYLFDEIAAGRYELRWFPSTVYLADNATKAPQRQRLLLLPDWTPLRDLAQQLAVRNLVLAEEGRFGSFTLYTLRERTQSACLWCLCQPRTVFTLLQPTEADALLRQSRRQ